MKLKKRELLYQEAGKFFLDLSKLVFGGIILAENYSKSKKNYGTDLFFYRFRISSNSYHALFRLV